MYYYGKNCQFFIDKIVGDKEIFSSSDPKDLKDRFPESIEYMEKNKVHAIVISRINGKGFFVFYENNVTRMWQDYDLVLIEYASSLLAYK